ncbi:metallophosphoesterase family protein [Bradyrhizobium sp. CNPSo 4010]|uniref:Metallophosphoesterase family protein n=1 Tax=Bradyrhizobium agreste TaxID=2751811 RepID=A0ABS0PK43_9BRAD|nr:metallophosphoesterase family protein [Bradyrhizobium agreste]MBH5397219.1 metallophosphoesterase family protein [Bradyrhizobium agreste]
MRILPISDIHLERRKLEELPQLDPSTFDVLVCAGDIWESQPEKAVQSVVHIAQGKPAIIVPGNHDVYTLDHTDKRTISDFHKQMQEEAERQNSRARDDIVIVLNSEQPEGEIGDVRFVGLTLWTDWSQAGRWMPPEIPELVARGSRFLAGHWRDGPKEFRAVRTERGPFSPYAFLAEHARERAILLDQVATLEREATVVVTHHAPLAHVADVYQEHRVPWWAPAFYCSDLLPNIHDSIRPELWIFGHVHASFDEQHGRTRVVCNPVEGGHFNAGLVIEIRPTEGEETGS